MINFYLSRDLFNWCSWTTKHWKHWKKEKKKKYPNLVQLFVVLFVICNRYSLQLYLFLEGFSISSTSCLRLVPLLFKIHLKISSDFSILDDISSRLATKVAQVITKRSALYSVSYTTIRESCRRIHFLGDFSKFFFFTSVTMLILDSG